ncbi:MAG: hypothetical protein JXB26_12550 [Candidatus Aminicenantes bacterium]|nr:hypothetical protein [Candidatus Aminicenantes bacterium]
MLCKKKCWVWIAVLTAGWLAASGQKQEQKTEGGDQNKIRTDLLRTTPSEPPETIRNIFTTAPLTGPEEKRAAEISIPVENRSIEEEKTGADEDPASFRLDLQYIGYIHSQGRLVALIFLEGNAFAVEEGELLAEGIKVGKITPRSLEIVGPGAEKHSYPLQGEER